MSFPFPPRGRKWLPRGGNGEGAWLDFEAAPQGHYGKLVQFLDYNEPVFRSSPHKGIMERPLFLHYLLAIHFEAAPTRALWKAYFASMSRAQHISKQPPQGHYGKKLRQRIAQDLAFRSSPHKGIMERAMALGRALSPLFRSSPHKGIMERRSDAASCPSQISKQPPQGHYGKGAAESAGVTYTFRSSPHKGIMERGCKTIMRDMTYFEAAPTRALWKDGRRHERKSEKISKQPPQGHYGKLTTQGAKDTMLFRSSPHKGIMESGREEGTPGTQISKQPPQGHYGKEKKSKCLSKCQFRSSPHKGIMERVRMTFILSVKYFEAAPTRALWKVESLSHDFPPHISKQPPQGHYGKAIERLKDELIIFRSSPHKGIMERYAGCRTWSGGYFEAAPTRALWKG